MTTTTTTTTTTTAVELFKTEFAKIMGKRKEISAFMLRDKILTTFYRVAEDFDCNDNDFWGTIEGESFEASYEYDEKEFRMKGHKFNGNTMTWETYNYRPIVITEHNGGFYAG